MCRVPSVCPYAPVPQGPSGDLSGEIVFTNTGNGLRPFAPVHLKAVREPASGDVQLSRIWRTRVAAQQTADFGAPPVSLSWRVAQISRAYGRGVQAEAISTL